MLQIAICDDEPLLLAHIENQVRRCLEKQHILPDIRSYQNGGHLLYALEDGAFFDLVLADIEMPDLSGMELAKQIHKKLPAALIIFVTAHYKYAVDAYELNIFRYVPKDQLSGRLAHALLDAASIIETQRTDSYLIANQNRMERIPLKDILYLMREGKNCIFHMKNRTETIKIRKSLAEVYKELPDGDFVFIDRGCIVNLRHVCAVEHADCILTEHIRLPAAQSRLPDLKQKLNKFWSSRI